MMIRRIDRTIFAKPLLSSSSEELRAINMEGIYFNVTLTTFTTESPQTPTYFAASQNEIILFYKTFCSDNAC